MSSSRLSPLSWKPGALENFSDASSLRIAFNRFTAPL